MRANHGRLLAAVGCRRANWLLFRIRGVTLAELYHLAVLKSHIWLYNFENTEEENWTPNEHFK